MKVLAIDVGGVLASKQHDGQPVEGSLEAIITLSQYYDLWIVSQCGRNRALKTREWLQEWGFDKYIPREKQVYIGFDEPDKNRVLKEIEADYFVDDRVKHIKPAQSFLVCFCFQPPLTWSTICEILVEEALRPVE